MQVAGVAGVTPTGTVDVWVNGVRKATAALDARGAAVVTLPKGTRTSLVVVTYGGRPHLPAVDRRTAPARRALTPPPAATRLRLLRAGEWGQTRPRTGAPVTLEHAPRVAMLSVHTSPLDQPGTGDAGGMNVYVLELARALAARGARVEIFTRATSSDQPETVLLPGADALGRPIVGGRRPHGPAGRRGRPRRDAADPRAPRARRPVRAAGQERPAGRPVRHGRGRAALGGRAPARLVRRRALPLLAVRAGRPDRGGPLGGAAGAHRPHAGAREERVPGPRRHPRADRARGRRGAAGGGGRRPGGQHPGRGRGAGRALRRRPRPRARRRARRGPGPLRAGRPAGGAAVARACPPTARSCSSPAACRR